MFGPSTNSSYVVTGNGGSVSNSSSSVPSTTNDTYSNTTSANSLNVLDFRENQGNASITAPEVENESPEALMNDIEDFGKFKYIYC